MLAFIVRCARRIIANQRGTVFIEYSSLVLLIAIAAIAMLGHSSGRPH